MHTETIVKKIFKYVLVFSLIMSLFSALGIGGAYLYVKEELPSVQVLKDVRLQTPMKVYSADGKLISQFGEKKRIPLTREQIPPQFINAFLATEDARFYQHIGVDFIGILRSAVKLALTGQKKQGASTITMQLARNFFLTRDKTYIRKIKEIFIALHIEKLLSKDEILTLYLNKIELGNRAFGIGAAAEVLYGKTVDQLTLPQMAMIAGLPKAPSTYNPLRRPKKARLRRNTVLWRMKETGDISPAQYAEASTTPVTATYHGAQIEIDAPYIAEMARQEMINNYGADTAYTQGFKVWTSVHSQSQEAAQLAVQNNLHSYDERHGYRKKTKTLWQTDEEAWSTEKIVNYLKPLKNYGLIKNAVVVEINPESNQFTFIDQSGEKGTVPWDGSKWARPFISNDSQGKTPNSINDILLLGQKIFVRPDNEQWRLAQLPQASAALVALEPKSGRIKALVGGYDFRQSEFNRATQAKRQVGSNIKPFIYSAALEHGFTLASIINDAPINQWDRRQGIAWRPKNSPAVYDGPIRMRVALAKSKNVVSVRLLRSIGLDNVIAHLTNFGFSPHELPRNESLALGSASFTPMEVATAFSTLSNGGRLISPYLIEKITDAHGNILFDINPPQECNNCENQLLGSNKEAFSSAEQVISPQNAFLISDAMKSAVFGGGNWNKGTGWNGTAWRARKLKRRDIGGKTGTTNDAKDTWFSGYTNNEVITSWVGFDNHSKALGQAKYNRNLGKGQIYGREFGAKTALPAWISYVKNAHSPEINKSKGSPANITTVRIDQKSGKLSSKTDFTSRFEYFVSGTEPKESIDANAEFNVLTAEMEGEVTEDTGEIF